MWKCKLKKQLKDKKMNDRQARELNMGWEKIKILQRASTKAEITQRIWENYFLPYKEEEKKNSTLINMRHGILKTSFCKVKTATCMKNPFGVSGVNFFPCSLSAWRVAGPWDGPFQCSTCPWVRGQGRAAARRSHAGARQDKAVGKAAKQASLFHFRVSLYWKIT